MTDPFSTPPTRQSLDARNGNWAAWDLGDRHVSVSFGSGLGELAHIRYVFMWGPEPTTEFCRPSPSQLEETWRWLCELSTTPTILT